MEEWNDLYNMLRSSILSPYVQHKHRCYKQQRHHKNRNRSSAKYKQFVVDNLVWSSISDHLHFNSWGIICIETPHASRASSCISTPRCCGCGFSLTNCPTSRRSSYRFRGGSAGRSYRCCTWCSWLRVCSYHEKFLNQVNKTTYHVFWVMPELLQLEIVLFYRM